MEEISAQADPMNTTIYVAGAPTGLVEAKVREHFARFVPQYQPNEVRWVDYRATGPVAAQRRSPSQRRLPASIGAEC